MRGNFLMNKDKDTLVEKNTFTQRQVERLIHHLEAARIADYVELLERPWRLISTNP